MGFSHPDYTVIKELGRGASGIVYLAVQKQLNRRVALKVIRQSLPTPANSQRFLREARILAQLDHPHILPVYELSELTDGQGYLLVMAYISGGTLSQREAEITLQQALIVVQHIADALGFAHASGFVHRDVKPDNILFHGELAMLADFGIARPTESQTQMTQHGAILGTPTYMSPEQLNGGAVDARSDLYSLGIVFYEMLAGRPPFQADSVMATGLQHLNSDIPALPSAFSTYQEFIECVLAKEKNTRPASAKEFIAELKKATDRQPWPMQERLSVLRTNVSHPVERASKRSRSAATDSKRKLITLAPLAAVFGVIVAIGYWFVSSGSIFTDQSDQQSKNLASVQQSAKANPELGEQATSDKVNSEGVADTNLDLLSNKLAQARQMWLDGNWFNGEVNAVTQYQTVLQADPLNEEARDSLNEIFESTLTKAQQQIQDNQFDVAASTLQQLQSHWAEDAQVLALAEQFQSAREMEQQAAALLAQLLATEKARGQQVELLVNKAIAAERANKFIAPENDNAYFYYQSVLAENPDNSESIRGLANIKSVLLQRVAQNTDSENFADAEQQLAHIDKLYPDDQSTATARATLAIRKRESEQLRVKQEKRAAEAQELQANISSLQTEVEQWIQQPSDSASDLSQGFLNRIALLRARAPQDTTLNTLETSITARVAEIQSSQQAKESSESEDAFRIPGF